MAAEKTSPETEADAPKPDPLHKSSLSWSTAFWTAILALSTIWAFWDEAFSKRPWKWYQSDFVTYYRQHLDNELKAAREAEKALRANDDYKDKISELEQAKTAADAAAKEELATLRARNQIVESNIHALQQLIKFPKAEKDALTYRLEVAPKPSKASYRNKIDRVANKTKYGAYILDANGKKGWKEFTFTEATKRWNELKVERDDLQRHIGKLLGPGADAQKALETFLESKRLNSTPPTLLALKAGLDSFDHDIKQIYVSDVDLIDRCESCHAGIMEPIQITQEDMFIAGLKGSGEKWVDPATQTPEQREKYKYKELADLRAAFVSHPRPDPASGHPDLLKIHPPDLFGCSPCHGGNGIATTSVYLAHGKNKHWLWPLYDRENVEAGCNQCHEDSLVLAGSTTLNEGKELFRHLGCWGCHKREHFNRDLEGLKAVGVALRDNERKMFDKNKESLAVSKEYDATEDDDKLVALLRRQDAITQEKSALKTERSALEKERRHLLDQRKRPGPNLKEIKAKVNPNWLPVWIKQPKAFRPTTRMPQFRLEDDQVRAIAAYLWQTALDPVAQKLPFQNQQRGNAENGEALFKARGCIACHALEGAGNDFAADLSRIGEKFNYDYLVRWIHNPRQRLAPYSPDAGRDMLPADFEAAGRKFEWSMTNSKCPTTGGEMVVQNMTVMPSLRLTWEEARDIASFLMTKKTDAAYPEAAYLNDKSLFDRGNQLVRHYGCAGCHEIAGHEDESGIGTELTKWGSKPLERLDFGLLTHEFKLEGKYKHKYFAMNKLKKPEIWDQGKEKPTLEKLRMPNFGLSDNQRVALTTFLLGSVDSRYPERFYHRPKGADRDIVDGWWVVKKYNCTGCHEIVPGQKPFIQSLPQYAGDKVGDAPPSLVGQGFRTRPDWLTGFLKNPALTTDTDPEELVHRNGVRPYLKVRMPTFNLTEEEVGKLVRFFAALSKQELPALDPPDQQLSQAELGMVQPLLQEKCLYCHVGGTERPGQPIIAPSFLLSGERLNPAWIERWLADPTSFLPKTKMPSGLFDLSKHPRVISGPIPDNMKNYKGDHIDLFVRYLRQFKRFEGQ